MIQKLLCGVLLCSMLVCVPTAISAESPTPTEGTPGTELQPLAQLPAELTEAQQREELLRMRTALCRDLELVAGVILNSGILSEIPPRIQAATGLRINELEQRETRACSQDPQKMSLPELRENVRTLEWLIRAHLVAMRDVTSEQPRLRPVRAEGAVADFLRLHDTIVVQMRDHIQALARQPSAEQGRKLQTFWTEVVQPHAKAEEKTLFPAARSLEIPAVTQSADLLEQEHAKIDQMVEQFGQALKKIDQGQMDAKQLLEQAQDLRGRVELHFAKEEESVIRPMQKQMEPSQFLPIVEAQQQAIGDWARKHGWETSAPTDDRHAAHHSKQAFQIPESIQQEHHKLHKRLEAAITSGGKTGEAAKRLQQVMSKHFADEERYAMPPLGLLEPLSMGAVTLEMRAAIEMAEHVKRNLPQFLEEHDKIRKALTELAAAASAEGKPEHVEFAEDLKLHARHEEQVLYPATILVGERLREQLGQQQ